jgi:hypothetical protein
MAVKIPRMGIRKGLLFHEREIHSLFLMHPDFRKTSGSTGKSGHGLVRTRKEATNHTDSDEEEKNGF